MSFNHRVFAHENDDEIWFQVHEVFYDEDKNPVAYTEDAIKIIADDLEGMVWTLNQIKGCIDKPILSYENFPEIWQPDQ